MASPKIEKLSISVPSEMIALAREVADEEGLSVSALFADAVAARLRNHNLKKLLEELEQKFGPISPAGVERARDEILSARIEASARAKARRRRK